MRKHAITTWAALIMAMAFAWPTFAAPVAPQACASHACGATSQSSRQFDFTSKINAVGYRVRVAIPQTKPPAGGFPVLYVLDGDGYFGLFADAMLIRSVVAPEVEPAIVVGIGYPTDDVYETLYRRSLDLTPSTDNALAGWLKPYKGQAVRFGGADQFLHVIQREIEPAVAKLAALDSDRRMIWGHSFGGLFVLNVLFNHPTAFHTYIALSPSFPYDNNIVLRNEGRFREQLAAGAISPRIFIGVGSRELGIPFESQTSPRRWSTKTDGSDPISRLADRLAGYSGPKGYATRFTLFEGETHTSMPFAGLNAVLEFALPLPPPVK